MNEIIYQDTSRYDLWLKVLLIGIVALLFVSSVMLFSTGEFEGGLIMLGAAIFDGLLFKAIMPSKFLIYKDRLKIVLGAPISFSLAFSNIKEAKKTGSSRMFVYGGLRFATSAAYVVEIVRKKGMSVVFSPASGEFFLEQLQRALKGK